MRRHMRLVLLTSLSFFMEFVEITDHPIGTNQRNEAKDHIIPYPRFALCHLLDLPFMPVQRMDEESTNHSRISTRCEEFRNA